MASYLHRTAQPSTLAIFRSWGNSTGAGRIRLAVANIGILFKRFNKFGRFGRFRKFNKFKTFNRFKMLNWFVFISESSNLQISKSTNPLIHHWPCNCRFS